MCSSEGSNLPFIFESIGVPGQIRTADLTLRRRALYPAELRGPDNPYCINACSAFAVRMYSS